MIKRYIAVLLVLIGLVVSAQAAFAMPDIGEGYSVPTFPELMQTAILLNAFDIADPKITDEYGRLIYCDLYKNNFHNDIVWNKIRDMIVSRVQKRKEYFRVKYEIVSLFNLGRYDFKKQFFPISSNMIVNIGSVNLFSPGDPVVDCAGRDVRVNFPPNVILQLNDPLTVTGFGVPIDKAEKMIVRIEEAGNTRRHVYGRIRMIVTDAEKGVRITGENIWGIILKGDVTSVDFFIDPQLTKKIGSLQFGHE